MTRRAPIFHRPRGVARFSDGTSRRRSGGVPMQAGVARVVLAVIAAMVGFGAVGRSPEAHGQTADRPGGQVASDGPALFTPGPGSVGAASVLESRLPASDSGAKLRQGWNGSGLLDLDASSSRPRPSGGMATVDALSGTEFEGSTVSPQRRDVAPGGGAQRPRAEASPTPTTQTGGGAPSSRPAEGDTLEEVDPALTGDCGFAGLGCLSRGMWALIGGLGAVGCVLVALIARELYFDR